MHLKLVALSAFLAVSSAMSLLTAGDYFINLDKDSVVIRGKYGRQIDIFFDRMYTTGMYSKGMIKIHVNGADMPLKTFKVMDYEVMPEGMYQSDILFKIFTQFAGQLDEQMFEHLMTMMTKYVQMHKIHPVFLQALKFLCYEDFAMMDMDMTMTSDYDMYMPYNKLGLMYGKMGYNKYNMYNMYDTMGMRMHTYDMPMYTQMYNKMYGMYNPMYRQLYGQTYGRDMDMMNMRMRTYMPQWWNRYNTMSQYRGMDYNTLPYNYMKMY